MCPPEDAVDAADKVTDTDVSPTATPTAAAADDDVPPTALNDELMADLDALEAVDTVKEATLELPNATTPTGSAALPGFTEFCAGFFQLVPSGLNGVERVLFLLPCV